MDTKSLAHPLTRKITMLERRYRRELMSVEKRMELREHILRLKAMARSAGAFLPRSDSPYDR